MTDHWPNHDNSDDWANDHAGSFVPCKRTLEMAARVADRESILASVGQSSYSQGKAVAADDIAQEIRKLGEEK